jgi:predicted phosphodiesterase
VKLHILSDLHAEMFPCTPVQTGADVVVLAGDIHAGLLGIEWIKKHFPEKPVIYIAGNHEFYGHAIPELLNDLHRAAAGTNIRILENESVQIDGGTFLGCTLWTDYTLWPDRPAAMAAAIKNLSDFDVIQGRTGRFQPEDSAKLHQESFRWLKDELKKHPPEKTVVVTHFAPCEKSIAPQYAGDILNAAFISPLDNFVQESGVPLWIHGHTHHCVDYQIGQTRVFSNQRGFAGHERTRFQPDAVIEL